MNNLNLFVILSFFFAIIGGFGIAGHLSSVLALGFPIRKSFPALVQAHGHLQLLGWVGFLLIGISLTVLPRLLSRPLKESPRIIAFFLAAGLIIRSLSQIILPYYEHHFLNILFLLGGILECLGIFAFLYLSVKTLLSADLLGRSAVMRLLPYFILSFIGWILFSVLNFQGVFSVYKLRTFLIPPALKLLQSDLFFYFTILPLSLVFSVKLLPLFLGLREPRWQIGYTGIIIFCGAMLRMAGVYFYNDVITVTGAGLLLTGGVFFILKLGLLRLTMPERLVTQYENGTLRGRGLIPDNGEYGRFELHIYAAYICFFLALILDFLQSTGVFKSPDAVRHLYLLGFVTNLIFGVAPRMLPGMLGAKLRQPGLVFGGFIILNIAVLGRVVPLIFYSLNNLLFKWAFALSGTLGLIAVSLLAFNLLRGEKHYVN